MPKTEAFRSRHRSAGDRHRDFRILKTAVGSEGCRLCPCDVDGNGFVVVSDALRCLGAAVGGFIARNCP